MVSQSTSGSGELSTSDSSGRISGSSDSSPLMVSCCNSGFAANLRQSWGGILVRVGGFELFSYTYLLLQLLSPLGET